LNEKPKIFDLEMQILPTTLLKSATYLKPVPCDLSPDPPLLQVFVQQYHYYKTQRFWAWKPVYPRSFAPSVGRRFQMGSTLDRLEPTLREALQELPEFTYASLPSASSIRLLEISTKKCNPKEEDKSYSDGYTKDVIVCKLHTADLDDLENPPSYDALSYTWGNPFSIFRSKEDAAKADILYATKVPIICNGMVLHVGRNLYDALLQLRMTRRSKLALNFFHSTLEPRPAVQQLVWIDAVCINQEDLLERNSQVQIMDQIYRNAETVHIWLGPHDDFSLPAVIVIDVLARAPSDSINKLELSSDLESSQYEGLGIKQISPEYWRCLFALLERRWFRRARIVQEVALSKFCLLNVGNVCFAWSKLVSATESLQASDTTTIIWNNGIRLLSVFSDPPPSMYLDAKVISASQVLEVNPMTIIHLIRDSGANFGIVDPLTEALAPLQPLNRLEILARFRLTQCQDPRDRVYAFLSLWPEETEPKPISKPLIVDYSRTVAQVYTDAAWAILKSSGNLDILSHVQNSHSTRTPGLPSWVPDWSCGTSFTSFENILRVNKGKKNSNNKCPYNASGGHIWQMASSSNENPNLLRVRGKKIGTVRTLAKFDDNNFAPLMLALIATLPFYIYRKIDPVQDGKPILQNISAKLTSLFHAQPNPDVSARYDAKTGNSDFWRLLEEALGSDKAAKPSIKKFEPWFETPFEALWRTLIADVWKDTHPAPVNAGFAFVGFLIESMQQLHVRLQRVKAGREEEIREPDIVMDPVLTSLLALADPKTNRSEECERLWRERIEALIDMSSIEEQSIHLYEQMLPHLPAPVRFLPLIESTADILLYQCKDPKDLIQWGRYLHKKKSLFSTSTGKLGVASTASRIDDEIWIVAGSKFPAILRQMQNGHYEFVGEAYVRGIMNGEALLWVEESPEFVGVTLE
jgi:hypothetical protein